MTLAGKIEQYLRRRLFSRVRETEPEAAYDLWAKAYDHQPLNLVLSLDKELFARMTEQITIRDREVIDVGCGTGRHWYNLLTQRPARLVGYDVSREMLRMLKLKFPGQEIHRQTNYQLDQPTNRFN